MEVHPKNIVNVEVDRIDVMNQIFNGPTQQTTETEKTYIKCPMNPVKSFVGREKELDELTTMLNGYKRVAVVGTSGIGKKQLVYQYASKNEKHYDHILSFNAESITVFTNDMHKFAAQLGIATKVEDNIRHFHVILQQMYNLFKNHCVLFIFNNVLDKSVFQYFMEPSLFEENFTLHVILISHYIDWNENEINCLHLPAFDESESLTLLQEELGTENVKSSENLWINLAGYVGHLPLAIHLISAYVKKCTRNGQHFDIEKYIHDIDRGSSDPLDRAYEPMKKILDMVYQEKYSKMARILINVSAFLNPNHIDIDSLKCFIGSEDENKFNYSLTLIVDYSLIQMNDNKVIIHPIIQQCIRLDQIQRLSNERYYKLALESVFKDNINCLHRSSVLKYAKSHFPIIFKYYKKSKTPDILQCLVQYGYLKPLKFILHSDSKAHFNPIIDKYGLLLYAIESRNLEIVKLICSFDIDVNVKNEKFNTPLYIASELGCKNIVEHLLEKKATTITQNTDGLSAIHVASMNLHHDIIKLLIKGNPKVINLPDGNNRTPLHLALLNDNFGNKEAIKKTVTLLLNSGASVKATDLEGRTVLHYAAKGAYHQTVPLILKNRWELLEMADNMGWTSLHIALTNNSYEHGEDIRKTIRVLIENDNPVRLIGKSSLSELEHIVNDTDDITTRIVENHTDTSECRDIAEAAKNDQGLLNIQDKEGRTPLHVAIAYGNKKNKCMTEIIKILIDNGAPLEAKDNEGQNVLHYAAKSALYQVISILINKKPNLIDMADIVGRKPLEYAYDKLKAKNNSDFSKTVILICSKGSVDIQENMKRTLVHYAAMCANYKFLSILLTDYPEHLNQPDVEGWAPIHLAVYADNSIKMNDIKITVQLLIDLGATVATKNAMGQTVLHLAAECSRHDIISLILKKEPELVNVEDNSGRTPLFYVLERYGPGIVQKIDDEKYELGNEDYVLESVRLLIKYGAHKNKMVNNEYSAFDNLTLEQREKLELYCDKFKDIQS